MSDTSKKEQLALLEKEYHACRRCPALCANRTQVVFGVGNPDACKIVIIGEAPGKREDELGEPFVGRSGQVLDSLLAEIGIAREEAYITNTILCRPPENRNPSPEELSNCRKRLEEHIRILDPKVVVTLGNFATKYMLETKRGITTLRGRVHQKGSMKIVPMFHPAVLLYSGNSPEKRAEMLKDFKIVQEILGSTPKKQPVEKKLSEYL